MISTKFSFLRANKKNARILDIKYLLSRTPQSTTWVPKNENLDVSSIRIYLKGGLME
jgi:hypothetical protein